MQLDCPAIICALRLHGEHGVIARALTPQAGLVVGYVRGGRSRTARPVLIAGNKVTLSLRARHADQLASMTAELLESRAPLMAEALAAAAIEWVTALAAATLPEDQPCPDIYEALDGLLAAIAAAPSARRWAGALVLFERALMQALGYGGTIPDLAEDWPSVMAGLNANAAALARHLLGDRRRDILAARERLVDRLKRAVA